MSEQSMRDFIIGILRDMEGNALLSLASGKTEPTKAAPHGKLKVDRHFWFRYPQELDLMVAFGEKARADAKDAYISPIIYGDEPFRDKFGNVVSSTRDHRPLYTRSLKNALFAQTVYMDSDACPPEAFRIPPSRHVQTSEGHGHDYWFLSSPVPAGIASEIAHRITTAHKEDGSDPSGWSANKVLRLPTFNTGYDELSPFEVTWVEDGTVYSDLDISGAYDDITVTSIASDAPFRELPPAPTQDTLLDFVELAQRIPESNKRLNDLLLKAPKVGDSGWRSEQLYALMLDLRRFGFTDEETIALAWASPASGKYKEDPRGVQGLWWELQVRVNPVIELERGEGISAAPNPAASLTPVELLSAEERVRVESRSDLYTLYLAYARSKVRNFNAPLHRANGWIMLATTLGDMGILPIDPRDLPPNLFVTQISPSSTGKSEAKNISDPIIDEMFPNSSPNIGARHSKEALIEQLHEREGKTSFVNADEAHGWIADLMTNKGGYSQGVTTILTESYDGKVPGIGRVGKPELNKPRRAVLTMSLIGPPRGMYDVLTKEMFYSGFLARMIWVIGEIQEVTDESLLTKIRRSTERLPTDAMPKWWASHLQQIRNRLRAQTPFSAKVADIMPTDEALKRHQQANIEMKKLFANEHDAELWTTVLRRMSDIIWKVATLRAMSDGRVILGLRDVEVALSFAEEWLTNAKEVASRISDTIFARQCDELEAYIAAQRDSRADLGAVYRFRRGERKDVVDGFIQSLIWQGRISQIEDPETKRAFYKIKEVEKP